MSDKSFTLHMTDTYQQPILYTPGRTDSPTDDDDPTTVAALVSGYIVVPVPLAKVLIVEVAGVPFQSWITQKLRTKAAIDSVLYG